MSIETMGILIAAIVLVAIVGMWRQGRKWRREHPGFDAWCDKTDEELQKKGL